MEKTEIMDSIVDQDQNRVNIFGKILAQHFLKLQTQWKSKSLDSGNVEKYTIQVDHKQLYTNPQTQQNNSSPKGKKKQQSSMPLGRKLPQPRVRKLNLKLFCIYFTRQIFIYYQKSDLRAKGKTFDCFQFKVPNDIIQIEGTADNKMFVACSDNIIIVKIDIIEGKYKITDKVTLAVPGIKIMLVQDSNRIFAVSHQKIYEFGDKNGKTDIVQQNIITASQEQKALYNQLNACDLVLQDNSNFYLFGTTTQLRTKVDMVQLQTKQNEVKKVKCQILVVVHFDLDRPLVKPSSPKSSTTPLQGKAIMKTYPVDHIFQTGLFARAKTYVIEDSMFLMGLYQQVILIKKHFDKFIVWDNVSILSSKGQARKGQLVLSDKRFLIYSQNDQIYAFDIYFSFSEGKLDMPQIDSFKGTQNQNQQLYDSVLIQYKKNQLMNVLFYFRSSEIKLPNGHQFALSTDQNKNIQENVLHFSIICITQSDPKEKLLWLIQQKKPNNIINDFVRRFNITPEQKKQGTWMVSQKGIKDIQHILEQITDDQFIEEQLDKILKSKPHDLNFLIIVERKKIERLKKTLVNRLMYSGGGFTENQRRNAYMITEQSQGNDNVFQQNEKKDSQYLNQNIRWLMQSIMFQKKLIYSQKFLSFKEYDFIQISKLKAASLKEEIKLLSAKKFEKRLHYFLNSFKYLAIANFQEIFNFLLQNKSIQELKEFIKSYRFIMPGFIQSSSVFIKKNDKKNLFKNVTKAITDLASDQRCTLWDEFRDPNAEVLTQDNMKLSIQVSGVEKKREKFDNIENFEKQINQQIQFACSKNKESELKNKAITKFKRTITRFMESTWFRNSAFKQHSMLSISTNQLYNRFFELKNQGVFKLLIKFLYKRVSQNSYTLKEVESLLDDFVTNGLIPQSFRRNIQARLQVYQFLQNELKDSKKISSKDTFPLRQRFLIMSQEQYFEHLFLYHRSLILRQIKRSYDKIDPDFFRERFTFYLTSLRCTIKELIDFLDQFQNPSTDDIRMDLFKCIKKLLKLSDYNNAKKFTQKSLDKQIFPQNRQFDAMALKEQAKIPYGFYFYYFFKALKVDYTYDQLIKFTNSPYLNASKVIMDLIDHYCQGKIIVNQQERCIITFQGQLTMDAIQDIDITDSPIEFFSLILFMLDTLDFKLPLIDVFITMVENYLNNDQFEILHQFISSLQAFDEVGPTIIHKDILMEFKVSNDISKTLSQTILMWIRSQFDAISNKKQIEMIFQGISNALQLLKDFSHQIQVERQRAFFQMLKLIQNFDSGLLVNIQDIRSQLQLSGFDFMINLMHKGNLQIFDEFATQIIEDLIYNFYCIYCQFKQASTGQIVSSTNNIQLQKFYIDLCIQLITKQYYHSALRVLYRVMSGSLYHRDLVLVFVGCMSKENINEDKLESFIKDLMETQSPALIKRKITAITELAASFLPLQQAQQSVYQVFKSIINMYKFDEAFFFLIKLPWLNLLQIQYHIQDSKLPKTQLAEHLVLTAFIRCLHQHLSNKFYPNIDFYKSKYSLLKNDFDRPGMIKDFNIALSRLQDCLDGRDKPYEDQQKRYNQHDSALSVVDQKAIRKSIEQLEHFYKYYMKCLNLDPYIKLTNQDYKDHTMRIERYSKQLIKPQSLMSAHQKKQEVDAKMGLQQNNKQLSNLNKQNKVKVIQKDIAQTISDAKKTAQKYQKLIESRRKDLPKRPQYPSDLDEINRRQKEDLQSIKDSFKSNTTERVNNLIDKLRKKRTKAIQQSRVHIAEDNQNQPFKSNKKQFRPPSVIIDKYLKKDTIKHMQVPASQPKNQKTKQAKQVPSPIQLVKKNKDEFISIRKQQIKRQSERVKQKIRQQQQEIQNKRRQRKQAAQKQHQRIKQKREDQTKKQIQKQQKVKQSIKKKKQQEERVQKSRKQQLEIEKNKQSQARSQALKKQQQRKKKQKQQQQELHKLQQQRKSRGQKKQQYFKSISQRRSQMKNSAKQKPSVVINYDSQDYTSSFSGASQYMVQIHSPKTSQKAESSNQIDNFIPITMQDKKQKKKNYEKQSQSSQLSQSNIQLSSVMMIKAKQAERYNSMRSELESSKRQKRTRKNSPDRIKKLSFEDIQNQFEKSQPQAKKYLPKLQMIKSNLRVGEQLTKRIYNVVKSFQSFYDFLCFLLNYDSKYKDIIEQKALIIVSQMIKMDITINFKMLFPLEFFFHVCPIPQKDYYPIAFDMLRPYLNKLLTPQSNIHAIAIMFCYGFGTDKLYSYKVYEDYGRILLKDYSLGALDYRKLYLYTEKIRNLYNNLNPVDRSIIFKQMIMEISNTDKRHKFIQALEDMIEKRSQSMSLSSLSQQFIRNVAALTKGIK